jgi:L-seryl-tRNA(Ser) seleniumtransferase
MKEDTFTMRDIPGIDKLLGILVTQLEVVPFPHHIVVDQLRQVVDEARCKLKNKQAVEITVDSLLANTKNKLKKLGQASLRKVVNGTGVVLHTNLGRAPLGERAIRSVNEVMSGYSTLEYNVEAGERGTRYAHITNKICALTGAQDAIVVNNNAAAVLLVLAVLAKDREVIVSRGQLVEIGGSFRVPDVLKQSGAVLIEVGATNKTHRRDYEEAITKDTGMILKVHTSNYRVVGFTSQPDDKELVALAHTHHLPVVCDLGSGTLWEVKTKEWHEPTVSECLASGIDVVTFSGDKLLGAGQAGIIAGKKIYIDMLKKHPLIRAIRIDKLSLAALEGTLLDYLQGNGKEVPVQRMLNQGVGELKEQAEELAGMLAFLGGEEWTIEVLPLLSQAGGGTLPAVDFPSFGVSIKGKTWSAAAMEKKLRSYSTPIIVRIQGEKIIIDVRCLAREDMYLIQQAYWVIEKEEQP